VSSYKRIDDKERIAIAKLISKGHTLSEIARSTGRTKSAISREIERQGGRENYKAEKFQEKIESLEEASDIVKGRSKDKAKPVRDQILKKLDHLESQIELMLFTIHTIRDQLEYLEELST
jgi:IS30 family transposase